MTTRPDPRGAVPGSPEPVLSLSVDPALGLVCLSGELDRESAPQLLPALRTLVGTSHRTWLVDAAQVTFCDAGGLRALAAAAALAEEHGGRLVVRAASRCVHRLLTLAGLEHLLPGAPPQVPAGPGPRPLREALAAGARPGGPTAPGAAPGDAGSLLVDVDHRRGSLRLTGRLDRRTAHLLHDLVAALLLSGRARWTADVSALTVGDHHGLEALDTARRRLFRNGRRLTLQGAPAALGQALARLGPASVFRDTPRHAAARPAEAVPRSA